MDESRRASVEAEGIMPFSARKPSLSFGLRTKYAAGSLGQLSTLASLPEFEVSDCDREPDVHGDIDVDPQIYLGTAEHLWMHLHPVHLRSGDSTYPPVPWQMAGCSTVSALVRAAASLPLEGKGAQNMTPKATISDGGMVLIATEGLDGDAHRGPNIYLPFAEIASVRLDPLQHLGSLIAIVPNLDGMPHGKAFDVSGWIFSCESCSVGAIMAALGRYGCVRSDIDECFENNTEKMLHSGSFFDVLRVKKCGSRSTGCIVAVKRSRPTTKAERVVREIYMLRLSQGHPNVIALHDVFHCSQDTGIQLWSMVLDYYSRGNLWEAILSTGGLDERRALIATHGAISALAHVHARDIIHRDVKPGHLIIAADGSVVLSDFGTATFAGDVVRLMMRIGTPGYIAPEVLLGERSTCKVDAFSMGVTLYFALSKAMPFCGSSAESVLRKTLACRPKCNHLISVSDECRDLIRRLVCCKVTRLSSSEASVHPCFFRSPCGSKI